MAAPTRVRARVFRPADLGSIPQCCYRQARLELRLRAGERRFVLTGLVCWSQPAGYGCIAGVEFELGTSDDVDAWRKWLKAL